LERYTQPLIKPWLGVELPGLGILAALVGLYLLGVVVTSLLGSLMLTILDWMLDRMPGFKTLYQAWKDVVLLPPDRPSTFHDVVLVPSVDGSEHWLGFTSGAPLPGKPDCCCVFMPNVPNPLTGRLFIVARDKCVPVPVTVAEAFKFYLSTGNH